MTITTTPVARTVADFHLVTAARALNALRGDYRGELTEAELYRIDLLLDSLGALTDALRRRGVVA